ncbi:MAG: YdgH/BhsA/McbA-like domain containing protein [Candidatus Malihini olakiniferum]
MNIIKKFSAIFALGLIYFGSFAAQNIGTVDVSGAETLSAFEAQQVAAKAEAAGASSYKIVSATGNDQLCSTAILYK